jgi:hypothetical protein
MLRLLLAHVLSLLATPVAAIGAVMLLARAAGRLTRWHSAAGGSDLMFSMPLGGTGWQIGSALVRGVAVFGIASLIFGLLSVKPTVFAVAALTLILASWDVHLFRLGTRPPLSPRPQTVAALRLKIVAGLLASAAMGLLFLR